MNIVYKHYLIGFIVNIYAFNVVLGIVSFINNISLNFDTFIVGSYIGLLVFIGQSLTDLIMYKIKYSHMTYEDYISFYILNKINLEED